MTIDDLKIIVSRRNAQWVLYLESGVFLTGGKWTEAEARMAIKTLNDVLDLLPTEVPA